ncbi:hypothetical protein MMC13_003547 [Lambiella insularis]|nr:hypothetical protein [Lambiella insularis]
MASHADDSSVDDNASSVGDSAWDIIDDASVTTSDEEGNRLSRQQTPSSDSLEHDHEVVGSVEGNTTSDESQEQKSAREPLSFGDVQHDSNSESRESRDASSVDHMAQLEEEMEDTNKGLRPLPAQPLPTQPFKFQEPKGASVFRTAVIDVSHTINMFEGSEYEKLCHTFELHQAPAFLVGTVRQKMTSGGLRVAEPYKITFVGPASVREAIIQKIGSALASSFDLTSTRSEIGLSKFTVVPISFGEGESPEVLLVDSLGLDMSIEDCTSASLVADGSSHDDISLKLNDHRVVKSSKQRLTNNFVLSEDYRLPDLAILFLPEHEAISAKQTRILVRSFMIRHGVPVIMIASNTDWHNFAQAITLDLRTPHICLEARDLEGKVQQVLRRLPVDMQTFLDIDSAQMGRNLACIASEATIFKNKENGEHRSAQQHQNFTSTLENWSKRARSRIARDSRYLSFYATCLLAALLLYGLAVATMHTFGTVSAPAPSRLDFDLKPNQLEFRLTTTPSTAPSITSQASVSSPSDSASIGDHATSKHVNLGHSHTDMASFLLAPTLTPNALASNKSDKFNLHVVGDCHVVLTPPKWFTQLKRGPTLLFKVTRQAEPLKYEFSTLFDGVYALKLAREDAYGTLNILVWTSKKPRINETFQVDFGTPWLKIAGWKRAAQAITEQVREELQSAQTGLNIAYGQTSTGVQAFLRDSVKMADLALKEVEKIGLASLNQTSKSTEIMLAQSKELSRTVTQHLHQHGAKVTSRIAKQRRNLYKDIDKYARQMSLLFTHQAQILAEAASGLNVATLAHEVQQYREKHLRETQKQALRMWWKVRGGPPRQRHKATRQEKMKKRRHARAMKGGNR